MNSNRVLAAFIAYAAAGLLLGASLEGLGISLQKGDVTLSQLAGANKQERSKQFNRILDNTAAAAKTFGFWVLPTLLATGLGAFFAHTERKDGTAFHFENNPISTWETYDD